MISSENKIGVIEHNIHLCQTLESSKLLDKGISSDGSTPKWWEAQDEFSQTADKEPSNEQQKHSLTKIKTSFGSNIMPGRLSASEFINLLNGK